MTARRPEEIADDYVLGLLGDYEAAEIEAAMEHDAALAAAIAASRDRWLELDLSAAPVPTSETLWSRIESGLSPASQSATRPANENRVSWRRLAWGGAMAASLLLAAIAGAILAPRDEPIVIAVLMNEGGEALALIEDFGDASARVIPLTQFAVPQGKTMQVWTLPSPEVGPVSLGLLPSSEASVLRGPDLPEPHPGQLYEITLENAGGSPTGRPTGPILVKGLAKVPG